MKMSIIIPTLNEAKTIGRLLKTLAIGKDSEVIVSDGGSSDNTIELARAGGAVTTAGPPGRGIQLNRGAALARGEILLFLHADARIRPDAINRIIDKLGTGGYSGGAFYLRVEDGGPLLRLAVWVANLRSRFLKIAYGDQGIFVLRGLFHELGGFEEIPLMEDYRFFQRLVKSGNILLIEDGLTASTRRWKKEGVLYATLRNWTLFYLCRLGVSPHRLAKWYGRVR